MKLYYSPGACSLAVHIVLNETDRRFDLVRVDLASKRTAGGGDFFEINPKGYVPVLELTGGERLTEATVILQYLADLEPTTKLTPPAGTFARYRLEEWLVFLASEVHKNFSWLFRKVPEEWAKQIRGKLGERLLYVADAVSDRAYLMGETFTIADAYLYAMLRWCERFGIDLHLYPNLADLQDRIAGRPSVIAALHAEGLGKQFRRSA
jgi:glutathione S-transferase